LIAKGYFVAAIDLGTASATTTQMAALSGVDLADPYSTDLAFSKVRKLGEPLAGLVNIAGGFAWESVLDGSIDTWDRMYRVNLRTTVNACMAAAPLMGSGASIVNIGAMSALAPGVGMAAYAAAKSGVARLTESLSAELKDRRIRVNALLPSIIDTPANRRDMPDADFSRWVSADQIASINLLLLVRRRQPHHRCIATDCRRVIDADWGCDLPRNDQPPAGSPAILFSPTRTHRPTRG
jgi:NAD(P)-dependent dehydrogenase (short-subunit alcohol dehydrogenase family)